VNISLINEIAEFCDAMNIDSRDVISAASTKPYGFTPFYPSLGAGGACIPVAPVYLATKARELGLTPKVIDQAIASNLERPSYFVGVAAGVLGSLSGKKIIVIGISYKPDVSDARNTPAQSLIRLLREAGATVFWHDEIVGSWQGEQTSALHSDYELAILANPHNGTTLQALGSIPIIDTRGGI
jgi:UDP-N-acetyl-D-glucosamine dehydrogenase